MRVHFVAVGFCLTISQNSYDVFQVLSLSILSFPREMSLLLAHYFADITLTTSACTSASWFPLLFLNLLQFQLFIGFSFMNNV